MADAGWIIGVVFAVGLVVLILASYNSYQRKKRIAQAKSRAALNQLLAEADELSQQGKQPPAEED